jgi:hypothetical protein
MKNIVPWALVIILAGLLIYVWMKEPKVITNTVIEHKTDTLHHWYPVTKYVTIKDFEFFEFHKDSLIYIGKTDSVAVPIPIEQRTYTDDSTYYAKVSGYHACLDYIEVYQKTTTIERTLERKPLLVVGPSVSLGYDPISKTCNTTIGLAVTVPIFTWYKK